MVVRKLHIDRLLEQIDQALGQCNVIFLLVLLRPLSSLLILLVGVHLVALSTAIARLECLAHLLLVHAGRIDLLLVILYHEVRFLFSMPCVGAVRHELRSLVPAARCLGRLSKEEAALDLIVIHFTNSILQRQERLGFQRLWWVGNKNSNWRETPE